eukprot:gb/GECH01000060.1/.p1 GENE.gb/GECH01000060.1/~~gb/GECH01000060.1/.p1  ORF type:complete len:354 (+),score=137.07 gb/GECH01000060.1/:1-1062(+)
MSSVEEKVRKQIEFYFSDSNLPNDKFLRSQCAMNPHGYVDISILADFPRVKKHTEDLSVVVSALKNSKELEVSKDEKMVRRVDPLPEEDVTLPRSIHMKEFPKDVTIDGLQEFFSKYGTVRSVRIRKFPGSDEPKGSAIIEFSSEDEANKILEKTIEYNGAPLIMTRKDQWIEKKKEKRQSKKKGKSQDEKREELFQQNKEKFSGCLVKITNLPQDIDYGSIKDLFGEIGLRAFIEVDGKEAIARVGSKADAESVLKELEGKEIQEHKISLQKVSEEEENQFLRKKAENELQSPRFNGGKKNQKDHSEPETKKKGKQRGKKRKSDIGEENSSEQPPEKKVKTEEGEDKVKTEE